MIAILIDVALLFLVVAAGVALVRAMAAPRRLPRDRFVAIGETTGKTLDEVTRMLGTPTSVTSVDADTVALTWIEPDREGGYHVEMQFRNGRSIGYTYMNEA